MLSRSSSTRVHYCMVHHISEKANEVFFLVVISFSGFSWSRCENSVYIHFVERLKTGWRMIFYYSILLLVLEVNGAGIEENILFVDLNWDEEPRQTIEMRRKIRTYIIELLYSCSLYLHISYICSLYKSLLAKKLTKELWRVLHNIRKKAGKDCKISEEKE